MVTTLLIVVVVVAVRVPVMRITVVLINLNVPKNERGHAADDAGEQANAQAGAEDAGAFGCGGAVRLVGRIS